MNGDSVSIDVTKKILHLQMMPERHKSAEWFWLFFRCCCCYRRQSVRFYHIYVILCFEWDLCYLVAICLARPMRTYSHSYCKQICIPFVLHKIDVWNEMRRPLHDTKWKNQNAKKEKFTWISFCVVCHMNRAEMDITVKIVVVSSKIGRCCFYPNGFCI